MNYLRRHPWSLLALLNLIGFSVLASLLAFKATPMLRLDADLAEQCYDYASNNPSARDVFIFITDTGAGRPLWIIGIASVLALVLRREYHIAWFWGPAQYVTKYLPDYFKNQFERPRPPFAEMGGYSFPSGHALGSAAIYGMLLYLVLRWWRGSRGRWVIAGLLVLHVALIAVSRMILSAHYLSDVLAGTFGGFAWAAFWAAIAEWSSNRDADDQPTA